MMEDTHTGHRKIIEKTLQNCYDAPTKISPPLKKLRSDYHYKVTEVHWGATPLRPSPSVPMA